MQESGGSAVPTRASGSGRRKVVRRAEGASSPRVCSAGPDASQLFLWLMNQGAWVGKEMVRNRCANAKAWWRGRESIAIVCADLSIWRRSPRHTILAFWDSGFCEERPCSCVVGRRFRSWIYSWRGSLACIRAAGSFAADAASLEAAVEGRVRWRPSLLFAGADSLVLLPRERWFTSLLAPALFRWRSPGWYARS